MDDNLKCFKEFVDKHHGELVLDGFDVVMLEGLKDDQDDDYYWVVTGKKGTYWTSCVGALYPLKDVLPEEQYNRMLEVYKLNVVRWKDIAEATREPEQIDRQMAAWELKWYGRQSQ